MTTKTTHFVFINVKGCDTSRDCACSATGGSSHDIIDSPWLTEEQEAKLTDSTREQAVERWKKHEAIEQLSPDDIVIEYRVSERPKYATAEDSWYPVLANHGKQWVYATVEQAQERNREREAFIRNRDGGEMGYEQRIEYRVISRWEQL